MFKRRNKSKKLIKSKKNYSRKSNKLYRGGDCGCKGNLRMNGGYGPSNFASLPQSHYYELTNPTSLPLPESSRLLKMNGGKKTTKNKKSKKNKLSKLMKGGNLLPNWSTNDPFGNNFTQYTGNTQGAILGNNLINAIPNASNNITDSNLLYPERVYNA